MYVYVVACVRLYVCECMLVCVPTGLCMRKCLCAFVRASVCVHGHTRVHASVRLCVCVFFVFMRVCFVWGGMVCL